MAAKRRATTELNRDNWDKEDEKEDPGTFKRLSEDELKNRVIRKAKRSLGNQKESSGISPFAAFSGFSKTSNSKNPFNFLKTDVQEGDASSVKISEMDVTKEKNGGATTNEDKTNDLMTEAKQMTDTNSSEKRKPVRSIEYYRQLQSLNESVMKWMQLHLSKNSCCDFTPVFNDYKKHLDTLNVTYPVKNNDSFYERYSSTQASVSSEEDSQPKSANNNVNHGFSFESNLKKEDETDYGANFKSNTTNTSTFSFGMKKTPTGTSSKSLRPTTSLREEAVAEKKSFQFSSELGSKEESTAEKKPFQFSFGLGTNTQQGNSRDSNFSKPFTFAASSVEKTTESESADTEDPEYVPPKNDFTAVKEEDAFYSKRCKLFFKKDDSYVERGIGTLHLKPLDGKTQLLIRADTSLGNILLNIILSDSLPISRTGKNNVLLMCVPNPPVDPKKADSKEAIPMLIRVKTSEDADELLETLNKHKS